MNLIHYFPSKLNVIWRILKFSFLYNRSRSNNIDHNDFQTSLQIKVLDFLLLYITMQNN